VDTEDTEQRIFINRGIGSNRRERVRGGAFGFGLSRDVCDDYRFLVLRIQNMLRQVYELSRQC
jgi:uncharacterized protein (DUF2235 family)